VRARTQIGPPTGLEHAVRRTDQVARRPACSRWKPEVGCDVAHAKMFGKVVNN
jgi:hypothetical protein